MTMIFVKAVQGRVAMKPGTRDAIDAVGELVEYGPYWRRRLDDGDVVESAPPKSPSKSATPAKE